MAYDTLTIDRNVMTNRVHREISPDTCASSVAGLLGHHKFRSHMLISRGTFLVSRRLQFVAKVSESQLSNEANCFPFCSF